MTFTWTVVVPIRTSQSFTVEATTAAEAKYQVGRWLGGLPSTAQPSDDLGQRTAWPSKRQWLTTREGVEP